MEKKLTSVIVAAFAAAFSAQGAAEIWVGGANASDANAGTAEAPFATIAAGIAACDDGGVVHVRAGNYPVSAQIEVAKAVSVLRLHQKD